MQVDSCRWGTDAVCAIIHGVLTNAAQYFWDEKPKINVKCLIMNDEVCLAVTNYIKRNPSKLTERFNSASARSDWVGVNVLFLVCNACQFNRPLMVPNDSSQEITCIVPIAHIR